VDKTPRPAGIYVDGDRTSDVTLKGDDADLREIDRWPGGVGWLAYPDEELRRASHALAVDGDVWVIDPLDAPGLDDLLADLGEVAGVVVGFHRHERDAAAIADRHGVRIHVPDWSSGIAAGSGVPVERFGAELADTGYRTLVVRNSSIPPWQEIGLFHEAEGTLFVPESLGTASIFRAPGERLGVHPMLRLFPPRRPLSGLDPERVLVGHGEGVFDRASEAVRAALDGSRRRTPSLYAGNLRQLLGG